MVDAPWLPTRRTPGNNLDNGRGVVVGFVPDFYSLTRFARLDLL